MPENIMDDEKCVTVGSVNQWHGLGPHFETPISAMEGHEAIGGSFELEKRPVGVDLGDGQFIEVPGHYAIVRGYSKKDRRKIVFDYVTDSYHIVQPVDIFKKFDEKVSVSIASAGFLGDGRKMFLSWDLNSIEVITGQEVKLFANVMFGFDSIFSSRVNVGSTVVVCQNTWNSALSEAERNNKSGKKNHGTIYSGKHTNPNLLNELGEWLQFIQENVEHETQLISGLFKQFASTPIVHEKQAEDLIMVSWPNPNPVPEQYPNALREKKQKQIDAETEKNSKIRDGIYNLFTGSEGIGITPDYFGLFNSATQFFNHKMPSKKDTSYSIMWGNRSNEMNHFAEVLRSDILSKG